MQLPKNRIAMSAADPVNDLKIVSFRGPTGSDHGILVRFHNSPSGHSPIRINKSTSLQFELIVQNMEMFMERTVFHELEQCDEPGDFIVRLPSVPKTAAQLENDDIETLVKMHLWHGEKHLGCWEAGSFIG